MWDLHPCTQYTCIIIIIIYMYGDGGATVRENDILYVTLGYTVIANSHAPGHCNIVNCKFMFVSFKVRSHQGNHQ